jgi:hypothetical protein
MDMTSALNLLFSFLVAAATVVVARATNKYVKLNASLVEETQLLRKAQTEPHISVLIRPQECQVIVDLIIRNDGQSQARDLRTEFYPDVYYYKGKKLSDVNFLQYIPSLQPGEQRTLPIWTGYLKPIEAKEKEVPEIMMVSVRYKNVLDNERNEQFPIPLRSFTYGESWGGDTALDKIADSLELVAKPHKRFMTIMTQAI